MATAQMNQQNPRPLPPRTLAMAGDYQPLIFLVYSTYSLDRIRSENL